MELKEKVQVIMERAVENCEVAGVNLLVEQDGKELCYAQAGLADRESHRPMDRDSILLWQRKQDRLCSLCVCAIC